MKRTALWVFCILPFIAGCAAEWPGLVVQTYPFDPRGKTILVQQFDFDPDSATRVNRDAVQGLGEAVALDIQRYLKEAGFRTVLVVRPGEPARGEILIRGAILRVDGGDARQRKTLELFGFGPTEVKVSGEILDLPSSRSALAFAFTRQSHYTWLDNESAVRENLQQIARAVAKAMKESRGSR